MQQLNLNAVTSSFWLFAWSLLFLTISRVLDKRDKIGPDIFSQGLVARKIPQPTYHHFTLFSGKAQKEQWCLLWKQGQ